MCVCILPLPLPLKYPCSPTHVDVWFLHLTISRWSLAWLTPLIAVSGFQTPIPSPKAERPALSTLLETMSLLSRSEAPRSGRSLVFHGLHQRCRRPSKSRGRARTLNCGGRRSLSSHPPIGSLRCDNSGQSFHLTEAWAWRRASKSPHSSLWIIVAVE